LFSKLKKDMPYSFTYFKKEIKEWFITNISIHNRILDVGPGVGTYSDLLYDLGYRIDALEIFEPYVHKYKLRDKYDNVYIGDINTFDISDYDFIIMGDVLEHIPKNDAINLIQKITKNKECLIAVPYEMEQGEHEGNIYETHHQTDLTHEVMFKRYPELTCIYRNEYYGYYTYVRAKEEKMYVLYANASYYNTVCAAVESINKVSNIPVLVYMLNDYRKVFGATTIYWQSNIKNLPKKDYINRNDSKIYHLLIERPVIVKHALENFAKTVCYVDSDSIATIYVNNIFKYYDEESKYPYFTEGIYDYLHSNGRGGAENKSDLSTTLEHPACNLFNVNQYVRDKYRQTGYFVAGQNTIPFLNEWNWMCNHPEILHNPQYYAPYHEETIVNVLLWKHNFLDGLPYIYTNAGLDKFDKIYNKNNWGKYLEPWFKLPNSETELFFLHGEKDPIKMSKIMSKLPSKMSKPLRIMFIAPHLSTGGMPQFLLKRIETLKTYTDIEIFVVEYQCHSIDFVVQRNQIMNLVPVHTLYENKMELFEVIDQFNPDVIHIDEMSERLDRKMISKLYTNNRKYKIVETCHDVSFQPEKEKLYIPDAYAFCTPYHLDTFNTSGYKEVIEYPIDPINISTNEKLQAKFELGMDSTKKHVINVGLWTKGKNQGEALSLAKKLPNIEFHFIGNQAGNFKDYWEPLMKNVPENVTIWGERKDINMFMKAADIFLFNSTNECNPLVLREAISYGLPILARNLPQYKDMFTDYITNLDVFKIKNQLKALLKFDNIYQPKSDNLSKDFANNHKKLYDDIILIPSNKNNVKDYNIVQNFIEQPFLEITGTSESNFLVEFYDQNKLIYSNTIKCNHWVRLSRKYYTKWKTIVYKDGVEVYKNILNLEHKRVYISFESSSLGDTIAWMPYVEKFRCVHNCEVIVSTFKNFLFEKEYPMLEFVAPGTSVVNIYAMYKIGWFYNKESEPVLPNTIPLQQTATNILGLDYKEIKPKIVNNRVVSPLKQVAIATNSTAGCKFWTREAWQKVINYLHKKGYIIVNTSLEENPFDNCQSLVDKSMDSTIETIANSKFFIGLSSGLSWLAWALNKEVIMISNFTESDHEFKCIRPVNKNVCHGCWNNPEYIFDKGDWNWCPVNKGTEKQFECQTSITPNIIIKQINKLI
jgi:autotransporter strand-loop-strand O-heptosyltransferase